MKFMYALLILLVAVNAHSAGLDLDGTHGYYELDTSKIDALAIRIIDDQRPIHQMWRQVINKAFRADPDPDHINEQDMRNIYCNIQEENGIERDSVPLWTFLKTETSSTIKEIDLISQVLLSISEKAKDDFCSKAASLRDKRLQEIIAYYEINLGPWKMGTMRNFINESILGIVGEIPFHLEERKQIFNAMKETGFLKTSIEDEDIDGYRYSQKIAAEEFLRNHKNIHTLVLGCGSFLPAHLSVPLFGHTEGECGMCPDGHCCSKGEMTVSLPASPGAENSSDIMGDLTSPHLWEGIKIGLDGRELDAIKDHSWIDGLANYSMEAFSVLKEGGLLEIWHPRSQDIPWGFVVKDQDENFLRLIKNSNL